MSKADAALLVADHHQGGEREAAPTLHGRGDAIDVDQLLDDLGVGAFLGGLGRIAVPATATAAAFTTLFVATGHSLFLRNSGRLRARRRPGP